MWWGVEQRTLIDGQNGTLKRGARQIDMALRLLDRHDPDRSTYPQRMVARQT